MIGDFIRGLNEVRNPVTFFSEERRLQAEEKTISGHLELDQSW